jgi:hypothetical protein
MPASLNKKNTENSSRLGDFCYPLFDHVPAHRLVFLRFAWGLVMLSEVYIFMVDDYKLTKEPLVKQRFLSKYTYFEWIPRASLERWTILLDIICVASVAFTIGFLNRLSAMTFLVTFIFLFLQDATHYSNYDYLICTLCAIFVFVPANRMWALDPKIRLAKKSQTISYWTLLLLRFIIALVNIFASVSKMNEDSIRGMPILHWLERNPRRLNMFKQPLFAIWLSWSDLLVNLISPFLFLVGREYVYRLYACFLACGKTLESFPFVVILIMSSILFEPDWPLKVINVCHKKKAYTIPLIIS